MRINQVQQTAGCLHFRSHPFIVKLPPQVTAEDVSQAHLHLGIAM